VCVYISIPVVQSLFWEYTIRFSLTDDVKNYLIIATYLLIMIAGRTNYVI
jgi:hypothetical protein